MRIAIDARLYGPAKNKGLGRYVEQLVKNLELVDPEPEQSSVQGKSNEYIILLRKDNWDEYQPRSLNFKKVLADYKWYSLTEQIFLPIKLWRLKVDLVHFPHFNVPLLYRGKFVVTIHDLIMYKFPNERATTRNKFLYKIKYWLHGVVVKSAVKRAEQIIAVSKHTKRDLVKEFGIVENKISVIYLGYEVSQEQETRNKKQETNEVLIKFNIRKPYLLYVGNAYPHKNLERLIKAFESVRLKYPNLQLMLVGKDDYFYEQLKQFSNLTMKQWNNEVIFTNHISNGGLTELYKNASVYVFPSLYEGFGLPGLEAMSYGLPVASSKASCLPEIYGEAALYFKPTDINDMTEKICQIIEDESLREELINKGLEQIKKYSWEGCARQTLETYAHLLNHGKAV
ncbi:glycosyltransferase family 4 protein [Candidatus Parcubacteria bacterium]|nr:glycosyltransferase family 4 protein [Patescibacteria group bacterium]MCG2693032.1 glycosyltransferase family 4 protein [Candidatus Parcubacteria bacterium]